MVNKEEPEKLFEIYNCQFWDSKEGMIKDIADKLKEFGYSTNDDMTQILLTLYANTEKFVEPFY